MRGIGAVGFGLECCGWLWSAQDRYGQAVKKMRGMDGDGLVCREMESCGLVRGKKCMVLERSGLDR